MKLILQVFSQKVKEKLVQSSLWKSNKTREPKYETKCTHISINIFEKSSNNVLEDLLHWNVKKGHSWTSECHCMNEGWVEDVKALNVVI